MSAIQTIAAVLILIGTTVSLIRLVFIFEDLMGPNARHLALLEIFPLRWLICGPLCGWAGALIFLIDYAIKHPNSLF